MVSRSLVSLLITALLAVCCGVAHADVAQLKREIAAQEQKVKAAEAKLREASKAVNDNEAAQKKAEGAQLANLKKQAIPLLKDQRDAEDTLRRERQGVAALQGKLRGEASAQAEKQINGGGELDARVDSARTATKDWKDAIGQVPPVPKPRVLEGESDEIQDAFLKDDIRLLKEYESWADGELKRVEDEIKVAGKLVSWDAAKAKNGRSLNAEAKALKESLESRKKSIETAKKAAAADRQRLEKQRE
jgi:hypothetical protein